MTRGAGRPRVHTGPMQNCTLYLPVEIIEYLDQKAAVLGIHRSAVAILLFRQLIDGDQP
jgi:hypothetical protein